MAFPRPKEEEEEEEEAHRNGDDQQGRSKARPAPENKEKISLRPPHCAEQTELLSPRGIRPPCPRARARRGRRRVQRSRRRAAHYSAGAGEARIVRGVSEEEARQAARGDGEAR